MSLRGKCKMGKTCFIEIKATHEGKKKRSGEWEREWQKM